MNVKWLIDDYLIGYDDFEYTIVDAIKKAGHEIYVTKYIPFSANPDENIPYSNDDCVVTYGTHGFVSQIQKKYSFQPGSYCPDDRLKCSHYMQYIDLDDLLNPEYIMIPYGEFIRRGKDHWLYYFGKSGKIFIRPDSGSKTFAGTVMPYHDFDHEINTLNKMTSATQDTMIMISKVQEILGEYRFVIVNGTVITGSEYKHDGVVQYMSGYPQECFDLANKIAKQDWQVDICYTCDVAVTKNGPKIIELNSFSCAGLYACDKDAIVNAISEAAWKEYNGELYLKD